MKNTKSRSRGRPVEEGAVHAASWRARAEDQNERVNALRARWVAVRDVAGPWHRLVALLGRLTAPWPAQIAERVAAEPDPIVLAWADTAIPPPPCGEVMRPRLQGLHDSPQVTAAIDALVRAVYQYDLTQLPPAPRTAAAAREQWLRARTEAVRARLRVRHGHARRDELLAAVEHELTTFRVSWWGWAGVLSEASTPATVRVALEQLHRSALARLKTLGGRLPADRREHTTPAPRRRRARRTR